MKIRTDVDQVLQSRTPQQPSTVQQPVASPDQGIRGVSVREIDQAVAERLTSERSLNDALNIAQISQTLLQKAMVVTSQLRNIAEQAIVTGRTDDDALRNAMSDIQTSMRQYGETINAPQVTATGSTQVPAVPQIQEEMRLVSGVMEQYNGGSIPGGETLNDMDQRLAGRFAETGQALNRIQGQLQNLAGTYPGAREIVPEQAVPATAELISTAPSNALAMQGNINREAAIKLLGA